MSKPLAAPLPESRYSYRAAVLEVEKEIAEAERGVQKQLANELGLTEPQFSHRMRGKNAKFQVEHFGAIADFFKAPQGWPFVALTAEERKRRRARKIRA